ncbi:YeeE/YedE family protein [bacterium]|nr:YeeE/YedE family protein [candidate division CSSED10-310 bacterium]
MLEKIHSQKSLQLLLGLLIGIGFGFLLQKGGVTRYDVIIGQLLFKDWTVVRVMLTAVLTGTLGFHLLKTANLATFHLKPGSIGMSIIGGLIFGVGFAVLGYCPGTVAGAVGQGSLDALFGGITGILIGAGLLAAWYPKLSRSILEKGYFGEMTFPQLLHINTWVCVAAAGLLILGLLWFLRDLPPISSHV